MFAYAAVLAAIGLAWNARVIWAGILVGLATYFHFLVGGFWALAILALIGLKQGNWKIAWRYIGTYVPITLPIAYILFSERVLLPAPDISGFDLSLDQIYSVLRAPHHTAPFSSDQQMRMWLPGSVLLVIVTVLMVPLSRRLEGDKRTQVRWILLLNIYLMLCFVVAFIDRPTYFFGPFYIFRPNSLALFLTLMLGANLLRGVKIGKEIGILRICAPVAVILVALHRSAIAVTALFVLHQFPLERSIDPSQMELIKWLRQTDSQSTVLIENAPEADWIPRWLAMERLIHRPTFVNFKFVPTERNDLARWYRLIRWKEAVFKGECERISEQPVDYLVILRPATMKTMLACGSLAWTNDTYSVIKVR